MARSVRSSSQSIRSSAKFRRGTARGSRRLGILDYLLGDARSSEAHNAKSCLRTVPQVPITVESLGLILEVVLAIAVAAEAIFAKSLAATYA
jgi:hypothetical protein